MYLKCFLVIFRQKLYRKQWIKKLLMTPVTSEEGKYLIVSLSARIDFTSTCSSLTVMDVALYVLNHGKYYLKLCFLVMSVRQIFAAEL